METRLSHKLGQRIALTPQLTQSLKVLSMNCIELEQYLEALIESNPLLEVVDPQSSDTASELESVVDEGERDRYTDQDEPAYWEHHYGNSTAGIESDQEQLWAGDVCLSDSLHEQIDRQPMAKNERAVAHMLIDSLDDDGYFRTDPYQFAESLEGDISCDGALVEQVLRDVVQQLDPPGLGAATLVECLVLQLDPNCALDQQVMALLLHDIDSVTLADKKLAEKLNCDLETVLRMRERIRRLDPFPGHGLHGDSNFFVRPEIIFRRTHDHEIEVDIPDAGWRGIRVSGQWKDQVWTGADKTFMTQALKEAKWLTYALEQRSETLMRVAACLVRRQRAFLEYGVLGLKPLTLQDVAEEVGLHESTISRVTHGKYANTPIGVVELKRFFSAGLPTRGGHTISVHRVQHRVKTLIQSEPAGRPISDQMIADRLQAEGIQIARRTVAKYREQLGILPSSKRRHQSRG